MRKTYTANGDVVHLGALSLASDRGAGGGHGCEGSNDKRRKLHCDCWFEGCVCVGRVEPGVYLWLCLKEGKGSLEKGKRRVFILFSASRDAVVCT